MSAGKHGPNRLQTYLSIHRTVMKDFVAGAFVCSDELYLETLSDAYRMRGVIGCVGQIIIKVDKTLYVVGEERGQPLVQTGKYNYNVSVSGHKVFLRYDNSHVHQGHADEHHRHELDWKTGAKVSIRHIGKDGWPKLNEVIDEACAWYCDHRHELPHPDTCPVLRPHVTSVCGVSPAGVKL